MTARHCLASGSCQGALAPIGLALSMVLLAMPAVSAADLAPVKAPLMPAAPQADERASFEVEGIWDRSGFAPHRTFGLVAPQNAANTGSDPLRPLMAWDSQGDRGGLEATLRSRPLFYTGDAPTRLFLSGTFIADRANASGVADLSAAGSSSFVVVPLLGNVGLATGVGMNFLDALPHSTGWTFQSRGHTFGGAFGLQWDLRSGRLRVDTAAGVRVERLERTEKIGVHVEGFANSANPASLDYASSVDLDATFVSATFGARWAYGLNPALDLIGRLNFDVGYVNATADGRDTAAIGFPLIGPPLVLETSASASDSNLFLRAALAGGFSWTMTPSLSLTLLGTASWTSHVPYIRYGEVAPVGIGYARTTTMSIGFAEQASYGVRGGITMAFGP